MSQVTPTEKEPGQLPPHEGDTPPGIRRTTRVAMTLLGSLASGLAVPIVCSLYSPDSTLVELAIRGGVGAIAGGALGNISADFVAPRFYAYLWNATRETNSEESFV